MRITSPSSSLVLAIILASACGSAHGAYQWVDDYPLAPTAPGPTEYVIGAGDLVQVQVWDNDKLSTRGRVRADGQLALPLLGEMQAVGKPPKALARDIEGALREQKLVNAPRVTVAVEEVPTLKVSVLGQVAHAGTYALEPGSGVAEALASAGGLAEFAHKDQIYVLRRMPSPARIRFTFESLTELGRAASFRLQPGDIVVAE